MFNELDDWEKNDWEWLIVAIVGFLVGMFVGGLLW
jgi:hypothetical protein